MRVIRTALFAVGLAGLVLVFSVSREVKAVRNSAADFQDEDGTTREWVSAHERLRIGLWFSPWYEETFDDSPICGVGSTRLTAWSWSSVVLVASLGCLGLAYRWGCHVTEGPQ